MFIFDVVSNSIKKNQIIRLSFNFQKHQIIDNKAIAKIVRPIHSAKR
jgi:hypothetical protein